MGAGTQAHWVNSLISEVLSAPTSVPGTLQCLLACDQCLEDTEEGVRCARPKQRQNLETSTYAMQLCKS